MIAIDERYCKGCGICIHFCPKQALEVSKEANRRGFYTPCLISGAECTGCRQCELFCPDFAIWATIEKEGILG